VAVAIGQGEKAKGNEVETIFSGIVKPASRLGGVGAARRKAVFEQG